MAKKRSVTFPGLRILVAEDNPLNMEIITRMLAHFDLVAEQAFNGQEVLEKFNQAEFDLLILDIHMPKKNGFEVIQSVRKSPLHQPVIVALTASAQEAEASGLGFDSFLTKPIALDGVEQMLKEFFEDQMVSVTA